MNSDVMPSRVQMDAGVLKNLLSEVKETVARDYVETPNVKPTFSAADLWRIQKNSKLQNGFFRRRSL